MNALKTLHGEIMTRVCERLADCYHVSKVTYEAEEANAKFTEKEGEGWLEMTIYAHYGREKLQCYLSRYGTRRGGDYKNLLTNGTPEQLYAAINKLIEGKTA
ncbi:hypothetical protein [Cardiobacterium hominis]